MKPGKPRIPKSLRADGSARESTDCAAARGAQLCAEPAEIVARGGKQHREATVLRELAADFFHRRALIGSERTDDRGARRFGLARRRPLATSEAASGHADL